MTVLGLDCSTTICGWAFQKDGVVLDAGFIDISKFEKNGEKCAQAMRIIGSKYVYRNRRHDTETVNVS